MTIPTALSEDPFGFTGLTYDDVLLLPGNTDVIPSEADTSTRLSKRINLNIPIISAAMDTVTDSAMAIAMARLGGMGVIHRNLSIEDQAAHVDRVKRSESGMIINPVTIGADATIAEYDEVCGYYKVSGLPVVSEEGVLEGIITNRDIRYISRSDYEGIRVRDIMTPMPLVTARPGVSKDEAFALLSHNKIERLPLVDDAGKLAGLITLKDFVKTEQYPNATKDEDGRLRAGAAIGFFGDGYERAMTLVEAGVDALFVDTANGHSQGVLDMIARLKKDPAAAHVDVIGGQAATRLGAQAIIDAGADGVKVGVGPGSICTTRIIAGVGVLLVLLLIVLIPRGGSSSSASSGSSASAGSGQQLTHATSSLAAGSCGAGASDDESVMDAAPKGTKWVTTDSGWTGPSSKTAGPMVDSPIRSCFEHSAEGALYAATWTMLQLNDPAVSQQTYERYVINGTGWGTPSASAPQQVAGYQFLSYTPERAVVRLAVVIPERGTGWISADVTMVWQDGDWRLRVPDGNAKNPLGIGPVSDTTKFIRWGTV